MDCLLSLSELKLDEVSYTWDDVLTDPHNRKQAMNNTAFSDEQLAAFIKAAEAMKANYMDYWPSTLKGLTGNYSLYSMEDDSVWLVDTKDSTSMRDAEKIQLILAAQVA